MLKKFLIFVFLVVGLFIVTVNFVKTGKLQDFIDKNSSKSWAPKLQYYLGQFYLNLSNFEKAEFCFQRMVDKYKESNLYLGSMFNLGKTYEGNRKFKKAKEVYREILDKYPNTKEAFLSDKKLAVLAQMGE